MNRILSSVLVLGLALGVAAIPSGRAQEKPEKAPPALPEQKGSDCESLRSRNKGRWRSKS